MEKKRYTCPQTEVQFMTALHCIMETSINFLPPDPAPERKRPVF